MDQKVASTQALDPQRLLHLHNLTKEIAGFCRKQLRGYLEALALLLRPGACWET